MNIKEYIESGILEAYVLGALSEEELAKVEADIAMYPELEAERQAIEEAMFNFANEQAITPPASMQDEIWNAINPTSATAQDVPPSSTPKTVPLDSKDIAAPRPGWQRAAIWAAVLVSVLTNFMLLSQRNKGKEELQAMTSRLDSMVAQQELLAAEFKKQNDILTNPAMQTVIMRKDGDTNAAGMVYWNKQTGEAYLAFNNMQLPPQGKQYQLWVIQDGKPVDMGVIPNELVSSDGKMQRINMQVSSGQAFAISLEKEGGNPTPTEVYMVGAISS